MLFAKSLLVASALALLQGSNGSVLPRANSEGSTCKTSVKVDDGKVWIGVLTDQGKLIGDYSPLWNAAKNDLLDQFEDEPNDTTYSASKESDVNNGYYDVLSIEITMQGDYKGKHFSNSEWDTMLTTAKHCFGNAHSGVDLPTSWRTVAVDSGHRNREYYDLDVAFNTYKKH